MKKRKITLLCALLAVGLLASACSLPQSEGGATGSAASSQDIYDRIAEDQVFEELVQLTENQTLAYLDLNEGLLGDMAMGIDASRATPEMIVVLSAVDEEALTSAEEALQAYLAATLEEYRDYRPEEVPKLEAAVCRSKGLRAVLIVSKDADKAVKSLEAMWGK